jgi:hypothetical protein
MLRLEGNFHGLPPAAMNILVAFALDNALLGLEVRWSSERLMDRFEELFA